ncbi:MAG: acyl-CoA dehydrogenase family protein [Pseudomonadota bacterium]
MDFQLTQEQQMLQDSARRFLEDHCAFDSRSSLIARGSFDVAHWNTFAELGWLGMSLPEECGGFGGSAIETAILMEELGRSLCVEPFWAIAVLTAQTIMASGDNRAADMLSELAEGQARPVLAHGEAGALGTIEHVATTAIFTDKKWHLNGNKSLVIGGNAADRFIVSARTSGATSDRSGISLFVVKRDALGLNVHATRLIDNRWCVDIDLNDVEVSGFDVLGEIGAAFPAVENGYAHGMLGLCAEAIGLMEKSLWITRDYLRTRKQFGVALSTFQALQHRMSEMLTELELSRGMVHRALASMNADPVLRGRALSAAKVHVGRSGKFVCGQAIQLHGGIGVTEEYVIGHYFKRMTAIEYALGSSHFHLERLAEAERLQVC